MGIYMTMAPAADFDLFEPYEHDTILEVRTSRMKTMPGLKIQSGIDKNIRSGRIPVSFLGLEGDEHDLTFHGGKDKAIHGYCASHYPNWRDEFPAAASRFQPGGFGENLVMAHMNERNVCIGDIVSVGTDGLILQVSLPRQPCFKLNHRFQLKNFAPNTYKLSRTGWYYRVLQEGTIQAGDEVRLVERKWPRWTIERVQEYLHRNQNDAAMNEELSKIEDLGKEARGAFRTRVAKFEAKKKRAAAGEDDSSTAEKWRDYRIVEKKTQTPRITSFMLEAVNPDLGDDGEAESTRPLVGAHGRIKLPNGLVRSYSIVGGTVGQFELGVALEEHSQGGSAYLHGTARVGDVLKVGRITAAVKQAGAASHHVFIAGGIGITAFLKMIEGYRSTHWNTTLHYGVRRADDVPFRERVDALNGDGTVANGAQEGAIVRLYDASRGERMDIPAILDSLPWNSHVYVCGPRRMMDEAMREASARGLGEDEIHFEAFAADTGGDPFEVEVDIPSNGVKMGEKKLLKVGEDETLLEVLRKQLDEVPSSCEVGNCGTCKVTLMSGRVDHRGTALTEEEKLDSMLSCVSRGIGRIAIGI